jgi:hypothetical protein
MAELECQDETANPATPVKWVHQVKMDATARQANPVRQE